MTNGDVVTNVSWVTCVVYMNDGTILNIGSVANANMVYVATNNDIKPYAGLFSYNNIPNYF